MRARHLSLCMSALLSLAVVWQHATAGDPLLERGRYVARVAGCNDCHTAGYAQSAGQVPEAQWLTGDRLGWQGPWGTTYATNLRCYMAGISEAEWLARAPKLGARPPMPWFALRDMTEDDLRALYRLIRSLGPAGDDAPTFAPPGQSVSGPVVRFPTSPG